jgi:uncharacterized membrane protein YqiK
MKGLIKKWWFWLILVVLIALIVLFTWPIKCVLIANPEVSSPKTVVINLFNFLRQGCPLG